MKRAPFQTGAKYFTGEHQMWNSSVLPLGFPNYRFQLADEMGGCRGGAEKWRERSGRPQETFTVRLRTFYGTLFGKFWSGFLSVQEE